MSGVVNRDIFEDMRDSQFLPESILESLDLLRLKWCSEPSVHGGKKTAPVG